MHARFATGFFLHDGFWPLLALTQFRDHLQWSALPLLHAATRKYIFKYANHVSRGQLSRKPERQANTYSNTLITDRVRGAGNQNVHCRTDFLGWLGNLSDSTTLCFTFGWWRRGLLFLFLGLFGHRNCFER